MNNNDNNSGKISDGVSKKELSFTLVSSFAIFLTGLLMIICATFIGGKKQEEYIPEKTSSQDTEIKTDATESEDIFNDVTEYYVIKEDEDGYISVYLSSGELYKRLDIRTYTLPSSDRARLGVGIMVRSDGELETYIEGFSG